MTFFIHILSLLGQHYILGIVGCVEIRTPMNGIIGMLTLAKGKVEPNHPVMQYFDKAEELCDHLLSLINDILDMSRIEAGQRHSIRYFV